MERQSLRTLVILVPCRMLSWLSGITPNQQMTFRIMISALLENIHGVDSKGIKQGTTDYHHDHPLLRAVAKAILPSFEALSDLDLLRRCLCREPQALSALIWQWATKETLSGLPVVELATLLAVAHFNDGALSIITIVPKLGVTPGVHRVAVCYKRNYNRIRHSSRNS